MTGFVFNNKPVQNLFGFPSCASCVNKIQNEKPVDNSGKYESGLLIVVDRPEKTERGEYAWFGEEHPIIEAYKALNDGKKSDSLCPTFDYNVDALVTGVLPCPCTASLPYDQCLPRLRRTIFNEKTGDKPYVIMTVGDVATGAVLRLYDNTHFGFNHTSAQYYGRAIPLTMNGWNKWLVPVPGTREMGNYHNTEVKGVAICIWMKMAVAKAYQLLRREVTPYVEPEIKMISDSEDIKSEIEKAMSYKYIAFDYETNTLDPETVGGKLLTASISYGNGESEPDGTAAFYMTDPSVLKKWRELLKCPAKKIGANIKFEERWSLVNLNTPVNNWYWDICVGARALDCQPGTAGLKYQTFVNFGVIGYDDCVKDFISDRADGFNRLDQLDASNILLYNGLDSYFTYKCAHRQHLYLKMFF